MPLPPHDDPLRPLHVAARLALGMGIVFGLVGILAAYSMFRSMSQFNSIPGGMFAIVIAVGLGVYFGTATVLLVTMRPLRNGKMWAIIVDLGVAGLWLLLILATVASFAFRLVSRNLRPSQWIGFSLYLLAAAVFIWMIVLLIKGISRLRTVRARSLGFEPIFAEPVVPVESADVEERKHP